MKQLRRQQIDSVIELSNRILQQARMGEWDEVAVLEAERCELVQQCFKQVPTENDALELGPAIRKILVLNDEVIQLGKQHRNALGDGIRMTKVGQIAKSAYLRCVR